MTTQPDAATIADNLAPHVTQIVSDLRVWLEASGDFARDQAPLVAQEIIRYGIVHHALWVVVYIPIIAALVYLPFCVANRIPRHDSDRAPAIGFAAAIAWTIAALIGIHAVRDALQLTKALIAPRLYLIEYLSQWVS